MDKILLSFFILIFIAFAACTNTPIDKQLPAPVYSQDMSPDDRALAARSFVVLRESCQPLMNKYVTDIESIKIGKGLDRDRLLPGDGCLDYRCRNYGWDKQIAITIKLKDRLSVIPRDLYAQGHTLHFHLGGPKNPGMTIGKFPELCGAARTTDGSYDFYVSAPKLAFIQESTR